MVLASTCLMFCHSRNWPTVLDDQPCMLSEELLSRFSRIPQYYVALFRCIDVTLAKCSTDWISLLQCCIACRHLIPRFAWICLDLLWFAWGRLISSCPILRTRLALWKWSKLSRKNLEAAPLIPGSSWSPKMWRLVHGVYRRIDVYSLVSQW